MSPLNTDEQYLARAITLADNGRYTCSPNPAVGCVIVRDGEVLGEGWHRWAGQGHAEVNAVADANGDIAGATVYVSLEPCSFVGRTPACADLLVERGVARVVVAEEDPHPRVRGTGIARLQAAGVAAEVLPLPASKHLNLGCKSVHSRGLPYVRVKVAASLDGRTAMASGESQWITGADARADVQELRARSCAILTGVGTVLADDPSMTVRDERFADDGRIRQPRIVVADSKGRLPSTARIFRSSGGVTQVCAEAAETAGAATSGETDRDDDVIYTQGNRVDLPALMKWLADHDYNEVLVEAGAELTGAVLQAGCWDELVVYQAPRLLGASARAFASVSFDRLAETLSAEIVSHAMVGDDLKLVLKPRA